MIGVIAVNKSKSVNRQTVDLSEYPDLVVILLGMRVNAWSGIRTLAGFGPKIARSAAAQPDGLLLHENIVFSLAPPHIGMRQYWRDFDALEAWARSSPHADWWRTFLKNSGGTGFWHEAYFISGGMEAVYDDMSIKPGFLAFASSVPAQGRMFSARSRAGRKSSTEQSRPIVSEEDLYNQ